MERKISRLTKLFLVIFILSFILGQIPILPQKAMALAPIDQVCSTGVAGSNQYTFLSHEPYQSFQPTKNTLDAVQVYIKADIVQNATVLMSLINATSFPGRVIATKAANITDQWSWVTFDFNDLAIMPSGVYAIGLDNRAGHAVWKHGPANCYDRGFVVYDNEAHYDFDYGFAVYTYDTQNDPNQPNAGSEPSGSTVTGAFSGTTTAGSGQTPSASTSSAIKPPTKLTAEDVKDDYGGSILLKWFPSSTLGIDGYKVFRSDTSSGGFVEIVRTPAITGGYIDKNATKDVTFYYMVRAYKGTAESANSNIASAASKDDLTALKNEILKQHKENSGGIFSGWIGIGIALFIIGLIFLLIVGFVIFMIIRNRRKNSSPNETNTKGGKNA